MRGPGVKLSNQFANAFDFVSPRSQVRCFSFLNHDFGLTKMTFMFFSPWAAAPESQQSIIGHGFLGSNEACARSCEIEQTLVKAYVLVLATM